MKITTVVYWMLICFMISSCDRPKTEPEDQAENISTIDRTLYHGGDILTMEGEQPSYVEAVVTSNGLIEFTGTLEDAKSEFSDHVNEVNLNGRTMLPGFIDGHGHVVGVGLQAASAMDILPAPDGGGNTVEEIQMILKKWVSENQDLVARYGWIFGFGYDDAQLDRYPTKFDLDEISTEYPVIIIHQSAHLSVGNSKALERIGFNSETEDPKGGKIRRIKGSREPNGVLEETPHFMLLLEMMKDFDEEANMMMLEKGQELYASYGYTTAQDGRSSSSGNETLKHAAESDKLLLDIVSYPDMVVNKAALSSEYLSRAYKNKYRIGGVKLSLDGSPQGKTAWLSKPYKVPPEGQEQGYKGYATLKDDELQALVDTAYANNWQILAHANGDAAIQQYIEAVKKANEVYGNDDRRNVVIHAQTITETQLDDLVDEKIWPSFFPMHTFYWGDWHVQSVLGKERAYFISPTATALDKGLKFTSHHDAPVAFPNSIRVLAATVTRVSRSGEIIGPDQRVSPYVALKSLTEWAAYQHFEEDSKGTIKEGKLADFVILDKNPVKVDPMDLQGIQVMETIKEGKSIYIRP